MLTEHGNVARLDAQRTDKRSAARVADAQRLVVLAEELLFTAVVAERDRGVSWELSGRPWAESRGRRLTAGSLSD